MCVCDMLVANLVSLFLFSQKYRMKFGFNSYVCAIRKKFSCFMRTIEPIDYVINTAVRVRRRQTLKVEIKKG